MLALLAVCLSACLGLVAACGGSICGAETDSPVPGSLDAAVGSGGGARLAASWGRWRASPGAAADTAPRGLDSVRTVKSGWQADIDLHDVSYGLGAGREAQLGRHHGGCDVRLDAHRIHSPRVGIQP